MILSVELPDSFAHRLHLDGATGQRRALEIFAVDGYRSGELSRGQVGELLDMGFHETEQFLKENRAEIPLSMDEFQRSSDALEKLLAQ